MNVISYSNDKPIHTIAMIMWNVMINCSFTHERAHAHTHTQLYIYILYTYRPLGLCHNCLCPHRICMLVEKIMVLLGSLGKHSLSQSPLTIDLYA